MEAPIWKKMVDMEPGIYFFGGYREAPAYHGCLHTVENKKSYSQGCWMAFICELPPEPVMPPPDLKDGDPVWVREYENHEWDKRNFAGWAENGKIKTWFQGSKWAGEGGMTTWGFYRIPTEEELNG